MAIQDCRPDYSYRPNFTPSVGSGGPDCAAPVYEERRARLFAGGTFFRSKNGGESANLISIELLSSGSPIGWSLNVYVDGVLEETFTTTQTEVGGSPCPPQVAAALRVDVNANSNVIEMPPIDYGGSAVATDPIFDTTSSDPLIPGDRCVTSFGPTPLSGGDGPPTDDTTLPTIRTGPERSLIILALSEIIDREASDPGILETPPQDEKVRQWNGISWVAYIPNEDCQLLP